MNAKRYAGLFTRHGGSLNQIGYSIVLIRHITESIPRILQPEEARVWNRRRGRMTITIELTPEQEARLRVQAEEE